jgi:hypothetical protein
VAQSHLRSGGNDGVWAPFGVGRWEGKRTVTELGLEERYFHVIIGKAGAPRTALYTDLTRLQLMRKFLQPFRSGKNLFVDNRFVDLSSYTFIQIVKTIRTAAGRNADEIAETGEDRTREFIGLASGAPPILRFGVNSNWVLGIFGGITLALIVTSVWLLLHHS